MRIATYEEGVLHLVTDPFYVDPHTNELHFYSKHEEERKKSPDVGMNV